MKLEVQQEHKWLEQLIGEWRYESEAVMGPDKPPAKFTGAERVRSFGEAWVVSEGKGEGEAGECSNAFTLMTLGYDPAKKRFVGTFVGSMMNNLWIYEGTMDSSGNVLTLDTEGPSVKGDGSTMKYKDIIEIKSADHRILRSCFQTEDGEWQEFMTANYQRVK